MKNTIKWTIAVIAAVILCGCTSKEEKMKKAEEYYRQQGYTIFSQPTTNIPYDIENPDNYYILFAKDGFIYLDTEFKKNGRSAEKIYPNEKGISFKILEVSFGNVFTGSLVPTEFDFGPYGFDNDIKSISEACIIFAKCSKNDNPSENRVLWITTNDGCQIFYRIGKDEALCSIPEFLGSSSASVGWNYSASSTNSLYSYPSDLILEEEFTLDVFDDENTFEDYDIIPFWEYPFVLEECFSLKDLSFAGFTGRAILDKQNYPCDKIRQLASVYPEIKEDPDYFYIPLKRSCFEAIRRSVKESIKEYETKLQLQAMIQRFEEGGGSLLQILALLPDDALVDFVNKHAISFEEIYDEFGNNPIKAEKKYVPGTEMILKTRVETIKKDDGSYSYIIIHTNATQDGAYIYSNDDAFAEMDYPQTIWIAAKFIEREKDMWGYVTFKFIDLQLLGSAPYTARW